MKKVKEQLAIRLKEIIARIEYRKKEVLSAEKELEEINLAIKELNGPKAEIKKNES